MFTLEDCISRINQVLNYPAITYIDISHYFDQAISELNTNLRIGIRPISEIVSDNSNIYKNTPNVVLLKTIPEESPEGNSIPVYSEAPSDTAIIYYYDTSKAKFGILNNEKYSYYNKIYGIYNGISSETNEAVSYTYESYYVNDSIVLWNSIEHDYLRDINIENYLPIDVINLFFIPYICYKFTMRNGGDASIFVDEYVQGFQQIQTSYDIPNFVNLKEQAGKEAYTKDVENNIDNLNIKIPTRAIYDSMKIGNSIMPIYGGFYESGGWGI